MKSIDRLGQGFLGTAALAGVAALLVSACGGDSGSPGTGTGAQQPGPTGATPGPTGTPVVNADGSTTTTNADGSMTTTNADGSMTITDANGNTTVVPATDTGTTVTPLPTDTTVTPTPGQPLPPMKFCANSQAAPPVLFDFEDYDGISLPDDYTQNFGGVFDNVTLGPILAGFWHAGGQADGAADQQSFLFVAGDASNFGAQISDVPTQWGGAMGVWTAGGCFNASTFTGLSFSVRGMSGTGTAVVTIVTEATSPPGVDPLTEGTCVSNGAAGACVNPSVEFPVTLDWTTVQLPWTSFIGADGFGVAVAPDGSQVAGLTFSPSLEYVPEDPVAADAAFAAGLPYDAFIPVSVPVELALDNIGFY